MVEDEDHPTWSVNLVGDQETVFVGCRLVVIPGRLGPVAMARVIPLKAYKKHYEKLIKGVTGAKLWCERTARQYEEGIKMRDVRKVLRRIGY